MTHSDDKSITKLILFKWVKTLKNKPIMKNHFFSIFVLGLICVANVVSGYLYFKDGDNASMIFNGVVAIFSGGVIIHLSKSKK